MRDRAWGEFSLWEGVCMGITCLLLFLRSGLELCKMSQGEGTLERAKMWMGCISKIKENEKPQPFGFSKMRSLIYFTV
ncbi:hypothetical protein F220043C3_22480 [Enterocloster asparagiformis]